MCLAVPVMPVAIGRGMEALEFSSEGESGALKSAAADHAKVLAVAPASKRALAEVETTDAAAEAAEAKRRRIVGCSDEKYMYECSRFVWRNKREFCALEPDRKFSTKRMALLYMAKMNSDSVLRFARSVGKQWTDLCSDSGPHPVCPNMPFELERFQELSDHALERFAESAGSVLSIHKAPEGVSYRYRAVSLETTGADELEKILGS